MRSIVFGSFPVGKGGGGAFVKSVGRMWSFRFKIDLGPPAAVSANDLQKIARGNSGVVMGVEGTKVVD